ncbi:MAG: aminotransferase class III-fold pyridoxal phosphate-dependent enzyme [Alphaproteobacteria bacterium]|nr:aminotransferase class III-fold pyridoxal phosphate-dependent enzyme [Alphaproteobacteria bacterium]
MVQTVTRNVDIEAALSEARQAFLARNPKSFAKHTEACAVMPGGNTRSILFTSPFPLAIARGEGCRLWDEDGHDYVDFLGEYTAGIYGHSNPKIRAAVEKALAGGINLGGHTVMEAKLARAICQRFPSVKQVRFTNSGTEANLMALSTACVFTKRKKVMVFEGGYHGGVLYFGGGGIPTNMPFPWVLAQYNDSAGTKALLDRQGGEIAAILVEPMAGAGGCVPADPAFLKMLREEATRHGCLLIFDEVMTSRLSPGGMQQTLGIMPDLTTLGKYIGGGMSFGGFGGREDVMGLYDPRRPDAVPHAGTFNNNVLTMSAGVVGLTELYTPDVAVALNARGDALRERLDAACRKAGLPMQVIGRGSMMCVHFTSAPLRSPVDTAKADQKLKELYYLDMVAAGIWLARRGMMILSIPIGDGECARLAAAFEEFLSARRSLIEAVK